jgi:MurNAc alpha-1-phosphate uridylyltransferase
MRAIILAAGRGARLGALTANCPKPLLVVGAKPLIVYHLEALSQIGVKQVVINLAYLGQQLENYLGDGRHWGLSIQYSWEPYPLEVGGGIIQALPYLGTEPFLVINADIWTDYPLQQLRLPPAALGHLVLSHTLHQDQGDFALVNGQVQTPGVGVNYTYTGIALLAPALFTDFIAQVGQSLALLPILQQAITKHALTGEVYRGQWMDAGTPERFQALRNQLASLF